MNIYLRMNNISIGEKKTKKKTILRKWEKKIGKKFAAPDDEFELIKKLVNSEKTNNGYIV